ncbi:MAG: hypothetical protein IIB58_05530 [Planctomycetes bacterium]|nr:hypothetical protein [Planctomycetota bacterium]
MRKTPIYAASVLILAVLLSLAVLPIPWPGLANKAAGDQAGPDEQAAPDRQAVIELREGLVIAPVGQYGRRAFHTDAIELQIATDTWSTPHVGDTIDLADGPRTWHKIKAADDGWFKHDSLKGGYLLCRVQLAEDRIMLLDASGHSVVYINGVIRIGDPYANGLVQLPVQLRAGDNELLFHCRRGKVRARLRPPPGPYFMDKRDMTLPDLIIGETPATDGAILVVNATAKRIGGLEARDGNTGGIILAATSEAGAISRRIVLKEIPPLSLRKLTIGFKGKTAVPEGDVVVNLTLRSTFDDSDFRRFTSRSRCARVGPIRAKCARSGVESTAAYSITRFCPHRDKTPTTQTSPGWS